MHVSAFFGLFCIVNLWKKIGLKALGNYSGPFFSYSFSICLGENQKPSFLWFRDFGMCPGAPKPIMFICWDTGMPKINQEHPWNIFRSIRFRNVTNFELHNFDSFRKDGRRTIPTFCLMESWKSWIWDQYLPENMKWVVGNMGSLKLWNFTTTKPGDQETKKPRNFGTKKPNKEARNYETKTCYAFSSKATPAPLNIPTPTPAQHLESFFNFSNVVPGSLRTWLSLSVGYYFHSNQIAIQVVCVVVLIWFFSIDSMAPFNILASCKSERRAPNIDRIWLRTFFFSLRDSLACEDMN